MRQNLYIIFTKCYPKIKIMPCLKDSVFQIKNKKIKISLSNFSHRQNTTFSQKFISQNPNQIIQKVKSMNQIQFESFNLQKEKDTYQLKEEQKNTVEVQSQISYEKQTGQNNAIAQNANKIHHSEYRPDIDGLRTIAVSIVIIFHAWPQFMTGGYIGVDVFFVLSGYLISGIIIKQNLKNKFSFLDFYSRRVKRIYPALILVLIFVMFFGIMEFLPVQLKSLSKMVTASSFFYANLSIMNNRQSYFNPFTKTNPLLHLWSLGVEQQFYIVWPLILTFTLKKFPKRILGFLVAFTLVSFTYSIINIYSDSKFAFYYPTCRFWEMSIGGLLAYKNIKTNNKYISNSLSFIGVFAIMITVWLMNEQNLFPGWFALIPTLSTACIIIGGENAFLNKHILSSKPFVFIGKISYPLYLWHWPLFVFSRTFFPIGSQSIFSIVWTIIFLTILFSVGTYFFVQNRLRYRKDKLVVFGLLAVMAVIGVAADNIYEDPQNFSIAFKYVKEIKTGNKPGPQDFYIKQGRKLPNSSKNRNRTFPTPSTIRYSIYNPNPKQVADLHWKVNSSSKYYQKQETYVPEEIQLRVVNEGQKNQLFIIGDSHAQRVAVRFQSLYLENAKNQKKDFPTLVLMNKHGLPFHQCSPLYNFSMKLIDEHKPQRILFVNRWKLYLMYGDKNGPLHESQQCLHGFTPYDYDYLQSFQDIKSDVQAFKNIVKDLKDRGIEVYVTTIQLQGPQFEPRNMFDLFGTIQKNVRPIKYSQFRQKNKQLYDLFQNAIESVGVKLVDFTDHYCWNDICEVVLPSGIPIFADNNHQMDSYNTYWASSVDFLVDFPQKTSK